MMRVMMQERQWWEWPAPGDWSLADVTRVWSRKWNKQPPHISSVRPIVCWMIILLASAVTRLMWVWSIGWCQPPPGVICSSWLQHCSALVSGVCSVWCINSLQSPHPAHYRSGWAGLHTLVSSRLSTLHYGQVWGLSWTKLQEAFWGILCCK